MNFLPLLLANVKLFIIPVLSAIAFLFGKKQQQNKQIQQDYEELREDINIVKKASNSDFADNADFLLAKQKNYKK